MNFYKNTLKIIMANLLLGMFIPGMAATATSNFTVSAQVQSSCVITSSALSFGNYVPSAASDASNQITVTCTNGTSYSIALNGGTHGSILGRKMSDGTNLMNYNLYTDAGHATIWGDGSEGIEESGTGSGSSQSYTAYGELPSGQYVAPGNYSDTITATVDY